MIKGALLDIDGTLLQSNAAHAQAWADVLSEHGVNVAPRVIEPLIGMGGDKLLQQIAPDIAADDTLASAIQERRKEIFLDVYVAQLIPTPGARALVEAIRDSGLTVTVATSASGSELDKLLRAAGVQELIQHTATKDDASQSKPAPDIVQSALEKSGLPADEAIMIGDTPYDIESARRAGVGTIAVRCGGHSDEDLSGAVAIFDDPLDLVRNWNASPLAGADSGTFATVTRDGS